MRTSRLIYGQGAPQLQLWERGPYILLVAPVSRSEVATDRMRSGGAQGASTSNVEPHPAPCRPSSRVLRTSQVGTWHPGRHKLPRKNHSKSLILGDVPGSVTRYASW